MQELQRFIVAKRVQRKKQQALKVRLKSQLKDTLEFIEGHGLQNQMGMEAKSLD